MKDFRMSKLHYPVHRVKLRKIHYRSILGISTVLILVVHYRWPEYESHMAVAVNLLFVIDPTA